MKTIIVTGASRGIGAAVVRALRAQGVRVVGVARSADALQRLAMEKIGSGPFEYIVGDVTDDSILQQAVKCAIKDGQSLDGLVLNAAILDPLARLPDMKMGDLKRHFDVNVFSQIALLQASLPFLRASEGRVILVSSGAAVRPMSGWLAYCSSKAAMNIMLGCVAQEEQPGLVLLSIKPGFVDTDMLQKGLGQESKAVMDGEPYAWLTGARERGELLEPEVPAAIIAQAVLCAPPSLSGSFMTWVEVRDKLQCY